jgi:hypothetical protein
MAAFYYAAGAAPGAAAAGAAPGAAAAGSGGGAEPFVLRELGGTAVNVLPLLLHIAKHKFTRMTHVMASIRRNAAAFHVSAVSDANVQKFLSSVMEKRDWGLGKSLRFNRFFHIQQRELDELGNDELSAAAKKMTDACTEAHGEAQKKINGVDGKAATVANVMTAEFLAKKRKRKRTEDYQAGKRDHAFSIRITLHGESGRTPDDDIKAVLKLVMSSSAVIKIDGIHGFRVGEKSIQQRKGRRRGAAGRGRVGPSQE